MGTPEFAVPSLQALLKASYNVVAVVSQPDRPFGRKRELQSSPVKMEAMKHGIKLLQPLKIRDPQIMHELQQIKPELIITAAYGQFLPKQLLELPHLGCINVHASILPRYRGGAPIQRAIMNGERTTGVTIMHMSERMDAGDIIASMSLNIPAEANAGDMFQQLSLAGAHLLLRTLPDIISGHAPRFSQNESEATFAPNLTRQDELLRWERPALDLFNQLRGLLPLPGGFTYWKQDIFKVWHALPPDPSETTSATPGTVLSISPNGLKIATGRGVFIASSVQPSGKKVIPVAEFAKSGQIKVGERLGDMHGGSV
jgi:methionyl-tRNA formyltransferase